MEQHTPPNKLLKKSSLETLEAQLRECFGKVVYSHKTHEKCADIYLENDHRVKIAQIVLSAITTGGLIVALGKIFGDERISSVIAVFTSTLLLIINTYTKEHNLGKIAQQHADTASSLWKIRESYLSLLTDLKTGDVSLDKIREEREKLQEELEGIYKSAPRTNLKAYTRAQEALKVKGDMTFSDDEIDRFVPSVLQKNTDYHSPPE